MRILQDDVDLVLIQRPFAGGLGAALYLGRDGEASIEYRRNRILQGAGTLIPLLEQFPLGAGSVPKSPAVDLVKSPIAELQASVPVGWLPGDVWANVRTHMADIENESIYRARPLSLDGDGDGTETILGTARVLRLEKRDAGGLLIDWIYTANRDGLQPEQFRIRKTSGPGSVPDVTTEALDDGRNYAFELAGLTHGAAYTFAIDAISGEITVAILTGIAFTADAAGPPAVVSLIAEEY